MRIGGLLKLTLLDYPGAVAATVFTRGCNFACPYCHNSSLIDRVGEEISCAEVLAFLQTRKGIYDGVCVSGGEPLMQEDLRDFLKSIKQMGFLVKLDTNGSFPKELEQLLEERLVDYVAMDLKNTLDKYSITSRRNNVEDLITESIRILSRSSVEFEFRVTLTNELHCCFDVKKIVELIQPKKEIFLQRYKDSPEVLEKEMFSEVDEKFIINIADEFSKYGIIANIRN